jgi:hypothetical protein
VIRAWLAALSIAALAPAAAAAQCNVHGGHQIVYLRSAELDPDVFVWDSQERVRAYAAGYWKSTSDVMDHTVLSKPGTRALVVECHEGVVKSKFANEVLDAIGIKLESGPNRGRYGWVTSEDIHVTTKTAALRTK